MPNGKINATDGDLENGSSSCERWGIFCGALVVVAVIAELVIAWIEPPYKTFLTESAITDAAIAVGIVGEVLFGMWDGRIQTELRRRSDDRVSEARRAAAQAHERAAVLEKEAAEARGRTAEIERLTAWRRISQEQYDQIVNRLRPKASSIDVLVQHEGNDPEAYSYARDITLALINAGVENVRFGSNSFLGQSVFGLVSELPPDGDASLLHIFAENGMPMTLIGGDISRILPRNERAPNWYIFVGPKPPPPYDGAAPLG